MPFARPTLRTLIDRASEDLNARLSGADSRLRRSLLYVIARVHAQAVHGLYGFGAFLAKQLFADTSGAEFLARQVSIYALTIPAAQKSTGTATFTGTEAATIPSATELQRSDEVLYVTTSSGVISGGTASVPIEAVLAAEDGNADTGTILALTSPLPGINSTPVTVDAPGLEGGTDIEGNEAQRTRLLDRIRKPPQGGATADYDAWAKLTPGVTRVFVYPQLNGDGTVGLAFMMDGRVVIIPLAADVTAVDTTAQVERPVTAEVSVFAPTALPVAYDVTVVPDTPEIRAAIEVELRDLHKRDAIPGSKDSAYRGTLKLGRWDEAISLAEGEVSHVLNAPVADVVPSTNIIFPTFGSIVFS